MSFGSVFLPFLLLALASTPCLLAQDPDCTNAEPRTENPLGSCACPGHLWIGPGCEEGYWCEDTLGNGCYKTCPEGEIVQAHFDTKTWDCVSETKALEVDGDLYADPRVSVKCPIGTYNVCPSEEVATTPDNLEGNPLGTCRCDGEIWVAEGCNYGFRCDESMTNGGEYKACPSGQTLYVDFETGEWSCTTNTETCPGAVHGYGCPMPECTYAKNPFGECGCDEQFFVNDDCTLGFYCQSNIPDPYLYDGCIQTCLDTEHLVPSFADESWSCVPKALVPSCPGKFNVECPDDNIGSNFNSSVCECDGQLHVSSDCKEGFYCLSRFPGGGRNLMCPEQDEILVIDWDNLGWTCEKSEQCPGLGGFKLGCQGGGNLEVPPLECDFAANPIGDCGDCEGQIFVNEDCTESFYCSSAIPDGEAADVNGCLLHCEPDERVFVDILTKEWRCEPRDPDFKCPGKFQVDCPDDDFPINCGCKNELWMNDDCTQAYLCSGPMVEGTNEGTVAACPPGKLIDIDYNKPWSFGCVDEGTKECPGSFHYGCDGGDFGDLTTPHAGGETTTTTAGAGVLNVILSLFLLTSFAARFV